MKTVEGNLCHSNVGELSNLVTARIKEKTRTLVKKYVTFIAFLSHDFAGVVMCVKYIVSYFCVFFCLFVCVQLVRSITACVRERECFVFSSCRLIVTMLFPVEGECDSW